MEKIQIKIYLTRLYFSHNFLLITPFVWFFLPLRESLSVSGTNIHRQWKFIKIIIPDDAMENLHASNLVDVNCYFRTINKFSWLCFSLTYTKLNRTEVIDIYGLNYDCKKDTPEGIKDKYHKLVNSGYFY